MNYMYIQPVKKKVVLHADGKDWSWVIEDKEYVLNSAIERLLVYYLYTGAYSSFHELLRANLPKKVNTVYSPEFLKSSFAEQHPSESLKEYNSDLIPLYADPTDGMWLSGDGKSWSFWITAEDERRILDLLKGDRAWSGSMLYLESISGRYSLGLDKESIAKSFESFLIQHGIKPETIRLKDSERMKASRLERNRVKQEKQDDVAMPQKSVKSSESAWWVVLVTLMVVVVVLWVLLFCGYSIGWLPIPILTMAIIGVAYAHRNKQPKGAGIDELGFFSVIYFILNVIVSIIAFALDTENSTIIAALNLFIPPLAFIRRLF